MTVILRVEYASLFLLITGLYIYFVDYSFWWYVGLFFLFDLSMLGYFINTKVGAYVYNVIHSVILPVIIVIVAVSLSSQIGLMLGLIWLAHIYFDRMMGYGLKYQDNFTHTHLI